MVFKIDNNIISTLKIMNLNILLLIFFKCIIAEYVRINPALSVLSIKMSGSMCSQRLHNLSLWTMSMRRTMPEGFIKILLVMPMYRTMLVMPITFVPLSKHEAYTTELHPKLRPTCFSFCLLSVSFLVLTDFYLRYCWILI